MSRCCISFSLFISANAPTPPPPSLYCTCSTTSGKLPAFLTPACFLCVNRGLCKSVRVCVERVGAKVEQGAA